MELTTGALIPILLLGAAGALVPWGMAKLFEDSLRGLMRALAVSAVVLIVLGALLFVGLYVEGGLAPSQLAERPGDGLRHFLALGFRAAMIWAPILLLTAISLGRGVEARRSRRLAARDGD